MAEGATWHRKGRRGRWRRGVGRYHVIFSLTCRSNGFICRPGSRPVYALLVRTRDASGSRCSWSSTCKVGGALFLHSSQRQSGLVRAKRREVQQVYSTVVSEVYRQLSNSPATRGRGVTLIVWSLPSSVPKRRSVSASAARGQPNRPSQFFTFLFDERVQSEDILNYIR